MATFSPLCFWQWAASALFTCLSASKSPNFSLCTQAQKGQHYKYINQASAYPISIINLSQADLMPYPYKKHRSRIGGNLPLCSGVAASSGELNGTQYSISICFFRRTPSPSSSCSSKSSKSSSSSPITSGAFTVKSSSYSQMSFLQLLFFLSLKPLNPLPNQWAPLGLKHGQSFWN